MALEVQFRVSLCQQKWVYSKANLCQITGLLLGTGQVWSRPLQRTQPGVENVEVQG